MVVLYVSGMDFLLLRTIWLSGGRCTVWSLCSGTWRHVIVNGIHRPLARGEHPMQSVVDLIIETPGQGTLDWKVFQC